MTPPATALKASLRADLLVALKARRADEIAALRALLAAIDNAEAPPIGAASGGAEIDRLVLSEREVADIMLRDILEREAAAEELAGVGQQERADTLLRQAEIVRCYLG